MYEIVMTFLSYENKLFDIFLIMEMLYRIFPFKKSFRFPKLFLVISILLGTAIFIFIDETFSISFTQFVLIYALIGFSFGAIFLEGRIYSKLITLFSCVSCLMLIRFIANSLFVNFVISSEILSLMQNILPQIILFAISRFIIKYSIAINYKLPVYYSVIMSVLMTSLLVIVIPLQQISLYDYSFLIIFSSLVYPLILILTLNYLFSKFVRDYEEKHQYKLLLKQIDIQKQYLDESTELYKDMRRLRHELKNHIFYMTSLLEQKKYNELQNYFRQVYRIEYSIDMIESGNNVVNAILNQKTAYAKSRNLDVLINAQLPEKLNVDEDQICAVISNLFDNAIEACETLNKPQITMNIKMVNGYINILCKNTVSRDILKENPTLHTSKKGSDHGIGLQVVRNIVEQYDGILNFEVRDSEFIASVALNNFSNKKVG